MDSWILTLLILSILLGLIEIFFVPGFGVFGIASFLFLFASAAVASEVYGLTAALGLLGGGIGLFALSFYFFFRSPMSQLLVLKDSSRSTGLGANGLREGIVGVASSPLHPAGKAVFVVDGQEKTLDVVSENDFLEAETSVVVSRIDGFRVVVRKNSKGVA